MTWSFLDVGKLRLKKSAARALSVKYEYKYTFSTNARLHKMYLK